MTKAAKSARRTTHTDRRDIMLDPDEERVYQEIHRLYREGKPVRVREHPSGFPTVTVDCGDLHVVTDIIRLGQWWAEKKYPEAIW